MHALVGRGDDGDNGLAAGYLTALAAVPYGGSVVLVEDRGALGSTGAELGCVLNLAGSGAADWATMRALVVEEEVRRRHGHDHVAVRATGGGGERGTERGAARDTARRAGPGSGEPGTGRNRDERGAREREDRAGILTERHRGARPLGGATAAAGEIVAAFGTKPDYHALLAPSVNPARPWFPLFL